MSLTSPLAIVFAVVVIGFLILDLGILSRRSKVVQFKESLLWTLFWVSLASAFGAGVWYYQGKDAAVTFFAAYLVEQSLSIDNLFVFLLIFTSFRVPSELQHRVLFWGIVSALVMRAVCIGLGVAALSKFTWLVYVFGVILVYAGIKTLRSDEKDDNPQNGLIVRLLSKLFPVTDSFHGQSFFVKKDGRLWATPLFLALVTIEISDLIFAVDSIPAVLAISRDPFIVYTSNIFAILGLRSIYFALANLMGLFHFLKYALSIILIFVGFKIGLSGYFHVPVEITLGVVIGLLGGSVILSMIFRKNGENHGKNSTKVD
jgi:tellurite resistance protein TerC